ncbi:MAG TPA: PEP-utilizing enzyme, partial [Yinghuangia sp.]|nr:PEP-utilizing enzyme [Yinghuangia sp.]
TQGERYHVSRAGHLLDADAVAPQEAPVLTEADLRRLAALARRAQKLFGGPQDIEFAFDTDDRLWLLQSRPITAMAPQPSRHARLLGPGPVAETFPDVLQPLEEDLWVAPMAHGLTVALDTSGSASRRMLRAVPPAVTVDGRVAADLRLLGAVPPTHRFLRLLNPIPAARQVGAAWRIGRLRATLPSLALDLMADIDRQLADYPAPDAMSGGEVLAAAGWGRRALSALHAQESLAGALLGTENDATIAGEALAALTEGRAAGDDDVTLLATRPVLLALFPPSLTQPARLPEHTSWTGVPRGVAALPVREALRLRIRWVQEMQAAMVRAYAARLTAAGLPADIDRVRLLRWHELLAVADGAPLPDDLPHRRPRPDRPELPARFRLADGVPVAEPPPRRRRRRVGGAAHPGGGQGAGGGTGTGTVWDGHGARPDHAVLVVRVLDPGLAPVLPGLAGLVAETGSPLSHLAVLAREQRVPTATAVPDAVTRFPVGTRVTVDGGTGEVEAHPDGTDDGLPAPPRADEGGPSAAPGTTPLHEADTRNVPRADVSWRSDRAERAVPDDASKGGSPC